MNIRKAISVMALCLFVAFMSSCQSKEEQVISKINKLADYVERNADSFSDEDWDKALADFSDLQEQAAECHFSNQQLKEFAKAEGRLTAVFTKKGANKLGDELQNLLEDSKEIFNGLLEGLSEGFGNENEK